MAIQMRRGNLADYDPDKMLPGEIGIATDENEAYISFGPGNSKRILTEDDAVPQTVQKIWTGRCATNRSTQVKIVTLDEPEGFSLTDGVIIGIVFVSGNDVASPKLNVNGTGEKSVGFNVAGSLYTPSELPYYRWGQSIVFFTYSANRWKITSADMAHIKYFEDNKANLASPIFTGTPKAPTASASTSDTQIATTKFVHDVNAKTRIWYGITNSNVSDAVKVVTVDDSDFSLTTGTLLLVDFKKANSATDISLNVNNLGNNHVSGSFAARIAQYSKILFWYSGTAWYAVEHLPIAVYTPASYPSRIVTTSNRFYGVVLDSNGFLSVCVPWEDTHGSLKVTDQGDGVVQLSIT